MPILSLLKRVSKNWCWTGEPEEFRASIGEHLDELRHRIIRIAILLLVGAVAGWFLQPNVTSLFTSLGSRAVPEGVVFKEVFSSFAEPFIVKLKISAYIGLVLVFPFVVLQLWGFVAPGLRSSERRMFLSVAPVSVLLFALGAFFGWIIMPSAFAWFFSYALEFPGSSIFQQPGLMVFFVLKMLLAFGIGFQLPLFVFALGRLGILSPGTLREYWRHTTVIIFFGAAILTPSNDIFSMLMMAVPLTLLFFISLFAVQLSNRRLRHHPELDELD